MRKDYLSKVVVAVRAKLSSSFGVAVSSEDTETLLATAAMLGYVEGKRGRDGGYLVTDNGLDFIGEDVKAFRTHEATINAAKKEAQEESRKSAAKIRKEALANEVKAALSAA